MQFLEAPINIFFALLLMSCTGARTYYGNWDDFTASLFEVDENIGINVKGNVDGNYYKNLKIKYSLEKLDDENADWSISKISSSFPEKASVTESQHETELLLESDSLGEINFDYIFALSQKGKYKIKVYLRSDKNFIEFFEPNYSDYQTVFYVELK